MTFSSASIFPINCDRGQITKFINCSIATSVKWRLQILLYRLELEMYIIKSEESLCKLWELHKWKRKSFPWTWSLCLSFSFDIVLQLGNNYNWWMGQFTPIFVPEGILFGTSFLKVKDLKYVLQISIVFSFSLQFALSIYFIC